MHSSQSFSQIAERRPFNGSQAALESLGKAILLDAATVCRGLGLSIPPLEKLQSNEVQLIGNTVVLELDHRSKLELCNSQLIGLDQGTRQEVGRTSSERIVNQLTYTNTTASPYNVSSSEMKNSTRVQVKSKSLQVSTSEQVSANLGVSMPLPGAAAAGPGFTVSYNLRNAHTMGEQSQTVRSSINTYTMNFSVLPGRAVTVERVEVSSHIRYWHTGNVQLVGSIKVTSKCSLLNTYWQRTPRTDNNTKDGKGLFSWAVPKAFEYTFGANWEGKPAHERVQCEVKQGGKQGGFIRWEAALQAHNSKASQGSQASKEFLAALDRLQRPATWECTISGIVEMETQHTNDRVVETRLHKPAATPAAAAAAVVPAVAQQPAVAATHAARLQPTAPELPPHMATAATQPPLHQQQQQQQQQPHHAVLQAVNMLAPAGVVGQPMPMQVVAQLPGHMG